MAALEVARDFDEIAPEYDATREPLDETTIARLAETLRERGVGELLEVGVGTGRIARPLTDRGLRVTGLDASFGMLHRARAKGLDRLVHGNAYRLPFEGHPFDGAIFVHVLHLLDDPRAALREAIRVSRIGAFALLNPPGTRRGPESDGPPRNARGIVYRILAERGYEVPRTGEGPPRRERAILAGLPPDRLDVLSDREVTEPIDRTLRMIERGASRHTLKIPKEALADAVRIARAEIGDRTFTWRRVEALAVWSHVPEGPPPTERTGAP
jgi:SAM-dependent methyltransferase